MSESSLNFKFREVGLHAIIFGLASSVTTLVGLILTPLYTRIFSIETFGIFSLINLCGSLAGIVFYLGVSSAIARTYFDFPEGEVRNEAISTALCLTLMGAAIQIISGVVWGAKISELIFSTSEYASVISICFASSSVVFVNAFFIVLLRYQKRSVAVASISIVTSLLIVGTILVFLKFMRLGILSPFLGGGVAQLLTLPILVYLNRKLIVFRFSSIQALDQLKFGLMSVLAGVVFFGLTSSDRFVINHLVGASSAGIYSLSYMVASIMTILLIVPFDQIYGPLRIQYRNSHDASHFFRLIATYFFIVGTLFSTVISVFSFEIISILSGRHEFSEGYIFVPFFMFGMLLFGGAATMANGVYFEKKVFLITKIYAFGVFVSIGLNYLLIPIFGFEVAAVNYFITYFIISVTLVLVSNKFFPALVDGHRVIQVIAGGAVAVILSVLFGGEISIGVIFFKCILLIIFLVYISKFVLNGDERLQIIGALKFRKT